MVKKFYLKPTNQISITYKKTLGTSVIYIPTSPPSLAFNPKKGLHLDFGQVVLTKLWAEEQDISQDLVLEDVCKKFNLNFKEMHAYANSEEIKNLYLSNSDEAVSKNVFGAPFFYTK